MNRLVWFRRGIVFVVMVVLVLAAWLILRDRRSEELPSPTSDPFPILARSPSPYKNTHPDVQYVGSEACLACHEDRHASFRSTGMGRSMASIDVDQEPPDAVFDHPLSKRRYQIERRGKQLWHRELLLSKEAKEIVLNEYPVHSVVGSGHHSRSYFVAIDGFLVESPITWYTAKKTWGVSPGYDSANHLGFERAAGEGCLDCHAGRARAQEKSLHRMVIHEMAISCERCHGPGQLHVDRYRGQGPTKVTAKTNVMDDTIVNPARLSRELAEAICQQCHLRSEAIIQARGYRPSDFRPGLPRQDVLHDFVSTTAEHQMTVVGHVEQMHLSKCYQQSSKLTCLTCHSPHNEPKPEQRLAHYQAVCASCHQPNACRVTEERRRRESPANDCVQCHMPRSPTEIPHLAFTHHRIAVHDRPLKPAIEAREPLQPFLDLARWGHADQQRSRGLAYLESANRATDLVLVQRARQRALALLEDAHGLGLPDGVLQAGLARLKFDLNHSDAARSAELALRDETLVGQDRCNALFILADAQLTQGDATRALTSLRELVRLRRHAMDWLLLAKCERALGHYEEERQALQTVVKINPGYREVHQHLARYYRARGDREQAEWHEVRSRP